MKSEDLHLHSLKAVSPIDGRHRIMTAPLSSWFSEYALFRFRLHIEVEYLIALTEESPSILRSLSAEEKDLLRSLVRHFSLTDAQHLQNLDRFGIGSQKPINHDCKSVEYFLKEKVVHTSLADIIEMVHFGLTSEDINNLAYNCMIRGGLRFYYLPRLVELVDSLRQLAVEEKDTAFLGRTHGQPAIPTTFGKEMAVYISRLQEEVEFMHKFILPGKLNGAVGTLAAHHFAAPQVDWISFSERFINSLGFKPFLITTQIEPHDGLARLFSSFIRINNILRDLSVDLWLYISMGYLSQKNLVHEVGSSTMPHKINPWRLEVAEGSTVEANAKFMGYLWKIQESRLQRDLSDHEAQRSMGEAVAHSYVAVLHLKEELTRLTPHREKMRADLADMGSILTEATQTLLRVEKVPHAYDLLKDFSRGRHCTLQELGVFIDSLPLSPEIKQKMRTLKPEQYTGLAGTLTLRAIQHWDYFRGNYHLPRPPLQRVIIDGTVLFDTPIPLLEKTCSLLTQQGLTILGISIPPSYAHVFHQHFAASEIPFDREAAFLGTMGSLFNEAYTKGLLCINLERNSAQRATYNIATIAELPEVLSSVEQGF